MDRLKAQKCVELPDAGMTVVPVKTDAFRDRSRARGRGRAPQPGRERHPPGIGDCRDRTARAAILCPAALGPEGLGSSGDDVAGTDERLRLVFGGVAGGPRPPRGRRTALPRTVPARQPGRGLLGRRPPVPAVAGVHPRDRQLRADPCDRAASGARRGGRRGAAPAHGAEVEGVGSGKGSRSRSSRWSARSLISRVFRSRWASGRSGSRSAARGDRKGVDRVGLAELRLRAPSARHQLRRHPDHPLAAGDQLALEATGDVATIPRAQTAARSRGRGPIRADARALPVACDRQLVAKLAGVELTAAAVWLCLWGSIPIVITAGAPPMLGVSRTDLRRTRLTGARARFYQVTPAIRPSPGHRQRCITASGGDAGTCAHHRATPACFIACRRGADEDPGG
jgi:hypothetical protein